VRLLGRLRDEESVPLLTRLAASGPENLRPFALAALGGIGGDAARGALRELVRQDGPWARFAWRALAECRAESDLDVFRAAVTHPDWHVRLVVAEVLGRSGETDDRRLLAALAADPMVAVSARASGELSK
jgi:HEAT repeat protein